MRILVTGAAGFIGSHLVEHLLELGHHVDGLDNFNNFYSPAIKRKNIAKANESERFTLLEGDLRDESFLANVLARHTPDAVIHLAAMAGVRPSIEKPGLYFDVNLRGTLNLLEACVAQKVSKIVFASSSSVYGKNEKVPFHESDPVDNPISPYAASKKAGELLCHTYAHLHGLSILCLRFFTVYGPRQRPDLAIHKFARLISAGEALPFFGDGSSRRDYTYIEDTIDGVLAALRYVLEADGPCYDIFNLGESRTVALSELVNLLENALGQKAILNRLPDQPGDVPITYADISRARAELGYHPTVTVETGIQRFVEWFRQQG